MSRALRVTVNTSSSLLDSSSLSSCMSSCTVLFPLMALISWIRAASCSAAEIVSISWEFFFPVLSASARKLFSVTA